MRKILCFLALFPLFSLNKANYSRKEFKAGILSISLSPLYVSGKSYFSVEVNAAELWTINIEIHIENDVHKDMTIFKKKYNEYEKTFIEYDNKYTRSKNKIVIYQKDFENTTKAKFEHEMNVVPHATSLIKNEYYSSTQVIYSYKNNKWSESNETLSLEGFEHLYSPNYYHKIDFDDFKVHLDSEIGRLRYSKASLLISNRNGVFDNLEHDSLYAHINLKFKEVEEKTYIFEFANSMYVDKHSLRMFNSYQNSLLKTRHFYLPVNEKRYEEEYECFLVVEGIGIDDAKLSHQFAIKTQKNIVGDCLNSEYCVVSS